MSRFICPHCHHPLAIDTLEVVCCGELAAWACPCCDALIPQPLGPAAQCPHANEPVAASESAVEEARA